jgi:hypothetical protein
MKVPNNTSLPSFTVTTNLPSDPPPVDCEDSEVDEDVLFKTLVSLDAEERLLADCDVGVCDELLPVDLLEVE